MFAAPRSGVVGRVLTYDGRDESDVGLVALEPFEPRIDSFPARAHEVDEQREIIDARVPLREQRTLEALESTDRLVEEPTNLGYVSARPGAPPS